MHICAKYQWVFAKDKQKETPLENKNQLWYKKKQQASKLQSTVDENFQVTGNNAELINEGTGDPCTTHI